MEKDSRIFLAGHNGMVGAAILRELNELGYTNILLRSHKELDLTNQQQCEDFYAKEKPEVVIIAAAKVGGIYANNTYPAEFIEENLAIALNCIRAAKINNVQRLLFLGSTCIYPRLAPQPIKESYLLTGELEQTNEAYAIAKIAGLKLCEYYRKQYNLCYHSAMPTNLYGQNDNYSENNSHVLPALIKRIHKAKVDGLEEVILWGSGTPLREFLHVDDVASACIHLLNIDNPPDLVNLGSGEEVSIRELAEIVAKVVGYEGRLVQDLSKPDGTPRKLSDCTLLKSLGWQAKYDLKSGIEATYKNFCEELSSGKIRL